MPSLQGPSAGHTQSSNGEQIRIQTNDGPVLPIRQERPMSQLYARVFTKILDSSIAEDWQARHVFEDFLKVCTVGECGGVVDMTREALARRFNIPLDVLTRCIDILEAPDPKSRDQREDGRRIVRLDDHRDWGWQIVNWAEYDKLRTNADVAARVQRHRENKKNGTTEPPKPTGFQPPTRDEILLHAAKIGLPPNEAEKFEHFYESKGWMVGKTKMRDWRRAMCGWRTRWQERNGGQQQLPTNDPWWFVDNVPEEKWTEEQRLKWSQS